MVPDLERAEHAALRGRVSRRARGLRDCRDRRCDAASRSRGLAHRIFNRVIGLDSIEPLDEIAAFYGDAPWWVSDSHGLGPELERARLHRDYGWMKFIARRRAA